MKKLDYFALNQAYSLSQFRNNPEYMALIKADADLKENLQANVQYLLDTINIDKAAGVFLDYWGWLVGISRRYFDISAYFSYNRADVNTEKYIRFSEPETDFVAPSGSLEDRDFRARIKAKAGANTSKCTREDNIAIIKNMTFAKKVKIKNVAIMLLDVTLVGDNLFFTQNTKSDIESVLGIGVGIRNLIVEKENGNTKTI
jgi:hypothetical protein|nr:MAG TPA: Protein of unknown function (DUF2612) [Caudoviricetes sp.]